MAPSARMERPEFLTARQAAELLQVHILTVYRLAESGEVPAFKAGRQWRFPRTAINRWADVGARHALDVLVADEDALVLRVFGGALSAAAFSVAWVGSCEEALEACRERTFHVIFLDLKLPGAGPVELMKQVMKLGQAPRFVITTSDPNDPLLAQVIRLDAVTVLEKPLDAHLVARALGQRDSHQE
jgi:excisionase family DNA binding protein